MTGEVRFTRAAERQLTEITDWTVDRFGAEQARKYLGTLLERCQSIRDGQAYERSCAGLVPGADDLRMTRAGSHYLIHRRQGGDLLIVAVLHARSNLARHLAALEAGSAPRERSED